jgi:hypothetical protein
MIDNHETLNSNLVQATIFENHKIIEKLIKHGANIMEGALYQALYFDDMPTLELLLKLDLENNQYFQKNLIFPALEPLTTHDNLQALILLDKYGLKDNLDRADYDKFVISCFYNFASNSMGYLLQKANILQDYYQLAPILEGFSSFFGKVTDYHGRKMNELKYHTFLETFHDYHPQLFEQLTVYGISKNLNNKYHFDSDDIKYLEGFVPFGFDPFKKFKDYPIHHIANFDYEKLVLEKFKNPDIQELNALNLMSEYSLNTQKDVIEKIFLELALDKTKTKKANTIKL